MFIDLLQNYWGNMDYPVQKLNLYGISGEKGSDLVGFWTVDGFHHAFPSIINPEIIEVDLVRGFEFKIELVCGFHEDLYRLGRYRRSYSALVQNKPCTVAKKYRDRVSLDTGWYSTSIHRAHAKNEYENISGYSPASQVIKDRDDWFFFMSFIEDLGQDTFNYLLLDQETWDEMGIINI